MKGGVKPKPIILRKLDGDKDKRRTNIEEPKARISKRIPPAPSYLPPLAKKEWKRAAKELHPLGLLTELDRTGLEAYCQAYSVFIDAVTKLQKHGMLIKAKSGFPVQSPYLNIANQASEKMRRWLTEFGMTPSGRTRLAIGQAEQKKAKGQELLT